MFTKISRGPILCLASWAALGFYRGMQEYEYFIRENPSKRMYSTKIMKGILGTIIYINPFLGLIVAQKEIYRLEVNMRGLETEKKTEYYHKLL
jgi:hypothetical protein